MAICAPFLADSLLPRGVLALATRTGTQTGITTITDVTGLTVQFTAVAGRRYRLYAETGIASTVATDVITFSITTSTNTVVQFRSLVPSVASFTTGIFATAIVTPAAGVVSYKCRVQRASGTGTVSVGGTATSPSYLIAEDIGPA